MYSKSWKHFTAAFLIQIFLHVSQKKSQQSYKEQSLHSSSLNTKLTAFIKIIACMQKASLPHPCMIPTCGSSVSLWAECVIMKLWESALSSRSMAQYWLNYVEYVSMLKSQRFFHLCLFTSAEALLCSVRDITPSPPHRTPAPLSWFNLLFLLLLVCLRAASPEADSRK